MTARFRLPGLLLAGFLLASVVLYAQENDEELFWILDRTEIVRSTNIPYFTVTGSSLTYRNTHHGYIYMRWIPVRA